MQALIRSILAAVVFTFIGALSAQAQSYYYLTLVNNDGNAATGCTVTINDNLSVPQTMLGVDYLLLATVTGGALDSIKTATCATGITITSANINDGVTLNWQTDTAHPTYALSGSFIEYRLPNISIAANSSVGFASSINSDFSANNDVLFASGGNPILLAPLLTRIAIPFAHPIILLFIALILGALGARFLRHPRVHRLGIFALFLCAVTLSSAVYSALNIALNGTGIGWEGASLLVTDTTGDVTPEEIDISHVYGAWQDNQLYLKLHMLKQPGSQTPNPAVAEFRLLGADITEPNDQSRIIASGDQDRIRGAAKQVRIKNINQNIEITVALSNNQWQTDIAAKSGDQIKLTPINANNEEGGAIYLTVQGTKQAPTLPPDPINDPNVAPKLNPQDIYTVYDSTKFLYTNNPPIQIGVAPDTIKPKLSSLIVGKVLKRDNTPLSGVTVKIKDHDQYGYTLTRADGQLDLVVNGGQWFTVEYTKDGYLPIQRKVQVAWQDYGYLPDVVMIPLDNKVSVIDLRETDHAFQIHQGSVSNDADGARQATILFPKGTTATMHLPNGSTQALDVLNVRATEYTIGENGPNTMPGELPPATGYTYAVELSVDQAIQQGANKVTFSEPLPMYVDNFLDFPVGVIVPLGWYSYEQKTWVPDDNGYVIKVLNISNGSATLDVKGDNIPATAAELAELNITEAELKEIAKRYPSDATFWRVTVSHFTPWDCNLSAGAPECQTGELCEPLLERVNEESWPDPENDDECPGCVIRPQNRSMAERVDVAGTPFSLHYESRRLKQPYPNKTTRRLRDNRPLQQGAISVESDVKILGRSIPIILKPASTVTTNEASEYNWDGRDRYGRKIESGIYEAHHSVTFVIQGLYYQSVAKAQNSFGQYSSTLTSLTSRGVLVFGATNTVRHFLSPPEGSVSVLLRTADLGRWTLGIHHHYDPASGVLMMGDGMDRSAQTITPQLKEVNKYSSGYGFYNKPIDVEPLPDGGALYLAEYYNLSGEPRTVRVIARISPEGTRQELWRGDSQNIWPTMIRHDTFGGGVYIVSNNEIHYRYRSGQIVHRAGRSDILSNDYSGNDVHSPFQVRFGRIDDINVGYDGSLYIVDGRAQCIRKLDAGGYIATVVGNCDKTKEEKSFADGIAATSFDLWTPYSIVLDRHNRLIIGAKVFLNGYSRCMMLRVDMSGRVYRSVGNSDDYICQERNEENPLLASFREPKALAVGYHDDVYFATNSFVRRLRNNKLDLVLGDSEALGSSISSADPQHNQFDALNILIQASPMKVDAGGNIYFRSGSGSIFMMTSGAPGFDGEEHLIPSSDGKQIFRFSAHGRHLQTLDALTGAVIYTFGYDSADLLHSTTDYDGKVTTIERGGNTVAIIGPYGHRTEITKGVNGATTIKNPAGEAWQFAYNSKGLMTSTTTPRGQISAYTYDENGRLITDTWPNGGGWTLNATNEQGRYKVNMTSGEGRSRSYDIKNEKTYWSNKPATTRQLESSTTTPNGLTTKTVNHSTNYSTTSYPDGTKLEQRVKGDPRFGVLAPYTSEYLLLGSEDTDENTKATHIKASREVETNDNALLPVVRWQESIDDWGSVSTREYIHTENLWLATTPSGKQTRVTVDDVHRPLKVEQNGEPTTTFTYSQGLVNRITQTATDDSATRQWQYNYDAQGNLAQILDPLNRASTFNYDAVGRITKQTLPDGRAIETVYDQQGNVKTIKTPTGDIHRYDYDAMGDTKKYAPPHIASGTTETHYQYDKDRKLTQIQLPDNQKINFNYGQITGRLEAITAPGINRTPGYDPLTGRLISWTDGTNTLTSTYGDVFVKDRTVSGEVNGTVRFEREENPKYLVSGIALSGGNATPKQYLQMKYDQDRRLETLTLPSNRDITMKRDIAGRLQTVKSWSDTDQDERLYNTFGELSGYRYQLASRTTGSVGVKDEVEITLDLAGAEESIDLLNIRGNITFKDQFAGLERLYLTAELKENEERTEFPNQWFNVYSTGFIYSSLAPQGIYPDHVGVPHDYYLTAEKNNEVLWKRKVGSLTRKQRPDSAFGYAGKYNEFHSYKRDLIVEQGPEPLLYYRMPHISRYGYEPVSPDEEAYTEVLKITPAIGKIERFPLRGETEYAPSPDMGMILLGAKDGDVFVQHKSGGAWLGNDDVCKEEKDGWDWWPSLGCITLQGKNKELQRIAHIDDYFRMDEDVYLLGIHYIDGSDHDFYAVSKYRSYIGNTDNIVIVDRWNTATGESKEIARFTIANGLTNDGNMEWSTAFSAKGLLIAPTISTNESYYPYSDVYYHVSEDGTVKTISIPSLFGSPNLNPGANTRSIFWSADQPNADYDCHVEIQVYSTNSTIHHPQSKGISELVCQLDNTWGVQRAVLPQGRLPRYPSVEYMPVKTYEVDWGMGNFNLYTYMMIPYQDGKSLLWQLGTPWATGNSDMKLITFDGEPMKTATLTINGTLSAETASAYMVDVARDALGRVTEKTETIDGNASKQAYSYDLAGRLVKVVTNGTEETWGYDANGNRTHKNGSAIASFDAQDRIVQQNAVMYQHNALGQRIEKNQSGQITAYDYDVFGGLKGVTLPDGTKIDYVLDPLGRRIGRKENGNWTNKWLYQDSLNPIAELDGNDRIRKLFIYADKANVPAYMITYKENGDEDKQYRIVSDLLGSVRLVYDLTTGDEVQRIDYDVWGNITSDTNPNFQPFGFAGGLYDNQTKLTRFGARDYEAETGRWLAKDPIGFNGGDTNLYGYVMNDPVNWIDINGFAGCYVSWPGYPITVPGTNTSVPLIHAGALTYDSSGNTRYYEYGRYDGDKFGKVERRTVPDLAMEDGKPTNKSWKKLQDALDKFGKGKETKMSCDDGVDANRANAFAEQRMHDPNRAPYSWNPFTFNTCTTFAHEVLEAGR